MQVTQTELKAYLSSLRPYLRQVHDIVDSLVKETEDTGDEDFQLASDLLDVFWKRCQQREDWKGESSS